MRQVLRRIGQTGVLLIVAALGVTVTRVDAQVAVSGRVKIQEKPGQGTTDLKYAVVSLLPRAPGARGRDTSVAVAMDGRVFAPHVVVVTPGSTVRYPHGDPFGHNVFSTIPGGSFDLGIYPSGDGKSTQFRKPGVFSIFCNIHPMMASFVVVVDTPWRGQPGPDGRWTIQGVPPGRYTLQVWHERGGTAAREVEVAAGMSPLDVELDARTFKAMAHKNKFGQDYASAGVRY